MIKILIAQTLLQTSEEVICITKMSEIFLFVNTRSCIYVDRDFFHPEIIKSIYVYQLFHMCEIEGFYSLNQNQFWDQTIF